jgi:hypothetical protein
MTDIDSQAPTVNGENTPDAALASAVLDRQITVTFGTGKMQKVWRDRRTMTFGAFIGELAHAEIGPKDGRCYVPAVFAGTARKMDFAERIEIAVLDSDCGHSRTEIAAAIQLKGSPALFIPRHRT